MPKYQLPPLSDENEFESLINELCKKIYNESFQLYGRKGSKQYGIDAVTVSSNKKLIVFQAKKKEILYKTDDANRKKLLEELEEEVEQFNKEFVEAKEYEVQEFIFASTFKRDTSIQNRALELSKKYSFKITYWSWDDISDYLEKYEDILLPFYGYLRQYNSQSIKEKFQKNSSILLTSRNLFISKNYIPIPELDKMHEFIQTDNEQNNILVVVGKAGIGKTALLSELQHQLKNENQAYLSIKSDQISLDSKSSLSKQFEVEDLYQAIIVLSQKESLTLIIDQLDALSLTLSSNRDALNYMLEFIESLKAIPNVNMVVSVREYDLNNDPLLRQIDDSNKIRLQLLPEAKLLEILGIEGIAKDRVSKKLQGLLTIPLHLALFLEVYSDEQSYVNIKSIQDLYELFWKEKIFSNLGELNEQNIRRLIYSVAHQMDNKQKIEISKLSFEDEYKKELDFLISRNIIVVNGKRIKFFHQTFYDYVFARDFIQSEKSLFEYITSRHQGLSIREQVKQVIEFLRGTDEDEYLEQIRLFLFEDGVHFHFKLLVIAYLGAIEHLLEEEFELLEELFNENRDNLLYFLESWISIGWMDYFVDAGYFRKEYLEDEKVAHRLKYKPIMFVNQDSHRMLDIVDGFPEIEDKTSLLFRMLYDLDSWDDYAIAIFEKYESESKNSHENSIYTYVDFLEKISKSNIDYSIDKLFDSLYKKLALQTEIDVDKKDLMDRNSLDLVEKLIEKEPLKVIKRALPYIEKVVLVSVHQYNKNAYLIYNRTFAYMDLDSEIYKIHSFYKEVLEQLKILAKEDRQTFIELLKPYQNSRHEALLGLFILGCEDEIELYQDELYAFFINLQLIEGISFNDTIGYSLLKSLERTFVLFNDVKQKTILDVINRINIKDEFFRIPMLGSYIGYKRYQLLLQISEGNLKKFGVFREFQELGRKFFSYQEEKPHKSSFGVVGAPLSADAYKHMTLETWKQSMKVYGYSSRDRHRLSSKDFLKGGKEEHSRAFEDTVKENPDKFYDFLLALKDDSEIEEDYLCSGLNALVAVKYDNEKIYKAILKFSACQDNYFQVSIIRAIHYLSHQDYFDEKFIDILISYKGIEYEGIVRDKEYESIHDNMTSAINSVQGVLAETLADIFKFAENENRDKVIALIEEVIESKYEYVVFGLLRRLGGVAKVDKDLYRRFIFQILERDKVGKITLYLMDVLHIFLNKKTVDFKTFENHVEKSLSFIKHHKSEEENSQKELGQILFYHYLTTQKEEQKNLLERSICVSTQILSGVIRQAFYEIKSDDTNMVELSKAYIVQYKNSEGVSWNFHFAMKNFHDGCFIENDLEFIKQIATSIHTRRESHDFWDYLKNEFYTKKSRAEKILEVIEVFIDNYQKGSEDYGYGNDEKIEFIRELYNRLKTDESKDNVLAILEKFLKNDSYRYAVQQKLDE